MVTSGTFLSSPTPPRGQERASNQQPLGLDVDPLTHGATNTLLGNQPAPALENWPRPTEAGGKSEPLAIIGMDLHMGDCKSLDDFYLSLLLGRQHFRELPPERCQELNLLYQELGAIGLPPINTLRGAWIDAHDMDPSRFKIKPNDRFAQQQVLMLNVADHAIHDAGLDSLEGKGAAIAVIIAMEAELALPNPLPQVTHKKRLEKLDKPLVDTLTNELKGATYAEDRSPSDIAGSVNTSIAARISSLMNFKGPSFTLSSHENGVYKALEIAHSLLCNREVDAVILGAVNLGGGLEHVLNRQPSHSIHTGPVSMSWDHNTKGWVIGEGAGAIVLKRASDATTDRVYARIDDCALVQSDTSDLHGIISANTVAESARQVLNRQRLRASDIGFLEVSASGITEEDQAEMTGLTQAYGENEPKLTCALGSSKAHIGHTFAASGIASIIKVALSLYHRFLPGVPNWEGPSAANLFTKSPFYVPDYSRPWLREKSKSLLRAAISGLSSDGTSAHILLSDGNHPTPTQPSTYLLQGGERLFPFRATTIDGLLERLASCEGLLSTTSFTQVSDQLCANFESLPASLQTLVLVASSNKELQQEIRFFQSKLKQIGSTAPLQTPIGSYYTPKPLGVTGKLALVYPGSGAAYLGKGALLLQAFPALYDMLYEQGYDPIDVLGANLYPRSLFALNSTAKREKENNLQTNALAMILIGGTFSGLYTSVLEDYLNVQAHSVFGYSLGETSTMWYSQRVWSTTNLDSTFVKAPLFREKIGGRMTLLATYWQLPEAEARARWSSRVIHQPKGIPGYASLADWFRQEVGPNETRVFLTFINTDTEIIISGDTIDLDRILRQHQLEAVSVTINNLAHHPFCRQVSDELIAMHDLPIQNQPDKVYYSSVTTKPLTIDSVTLANNTLEVCCRPVDWPSITRKMAADNHTIFIEVGAGATCSRWISEILSTQEHAVLPMDRKGAEVVRNLTGLVARLLAHGVPVNLIPFYKSKSATEISHKAILKPLQTDSPGLRSLLPKPKSNMNDSGQIKKDIPVPIKSSMVIPMENVRAALNQPSNTSSMETASVKSTSSPQQLGENGLLLQNYSDPNRLQGKSVIWNENDLLTFSTGKIQDVFGDEYALIDTYRRRVTLPMPPYLFASRVTKLEAQCHHYKTSHITTEYDIPYGSPYTTDGQITWAMSSEAGQGSLVLISYLGIDFQNKGEYVYRQLDCSLTFLDDLPFEGQTIRYEITIDRFVRNGQGLIFFFNYQCFAEDRLILKLENGCGGFFNENELTHGQGIVFSQQELDQRANRSRQSFIPLLECAKTTFTKEDLVALVQGDLASCFGDAYWPNSRNPSLRLPPAKLLMLDRITQVDQKGGSAGLGFVEAEKDLHPDDWYFPCHFRNDEVLAGSLQTEGGWQLVRFYMLLLGMQRITKDARFQPILGLPQKVRCRKEVRPKLGKLVYQMDVKEIGLLPEPYVVADVAIIYEGQIAILFENVGLRLQEKTKPAFLKKELPTQDGIYVKPVNKPVLFNEYHISQLALGNLYKSVGDSYKVFEGRSFSRQPNTDLQLTSRALSFTGTQFVFTNKPSLVAEYDVPADAWFYSQNAAPEMPYSILMEIALQPYGLLGYCLGVPLLFPDQDLFLRNLEGEGELLRSVDLRGKSIKIQVCLLSHTTLNGTILQRISFDLSVDEEIFYRGTTAFGHFSKEGLANQVGLDQGAHVDPWYLSNSTESQKSLSFKLDSLFGRTKLYHSTNPASPHLHLASGQLNLLDSALIVPAGGNYGQGYVFARKAIMPHNWFFSCHFYTDPVMPGSLGIEAMIQAMQLFVLQQGLADNLSNVSFRQVAPNKTAWKYRGQLLTSDSEMSLEVHIKTIERTSQSLRLTADASLWKGPLRIYEVTGLGLLVG